MIGDNKPEICHECKKEIDKIKGIYYTQISVGEELKVIALHLKCRNAIKVEVQAHYED